MRNCAKEIFLRPCSKDLPVLISQIAKTVQELTWNRKIWVWFDRVWKIGRVVLGLATSQKKWSRYVELIRLHILVNCMELRWRQPCSDSFAPCSIKDVETDKMIGKNPTANHANSNKISSKSKSSSRSFTSFQMFHTHTRTRPEPGQPWKARGRGKRTQTTGQRPKQRGGGKGTNGPPEPTYTAKRTWQGTGHTPKPHNTLRRSRERRVIRDQMID